MYIYNLLLRMTDTVSSQSIDLSFWDILYVVLTLSGSLVTTVWRVLRLRMEETVSRHGE
jgi:hypothetical protein